MRKIRPVSTVHQQRRQTAELDDSLTEKADLIALTGELAGNRYTVEERVVLGREHGVDVLVSGDDVSRRHAAVVRTSAAEFVVEDLGSRNGTMVNGVPIQVHVLKFGDKVQIGSRTLLVFAPHSAPEEQLIRWQRVEVIGQMAAGVVHDFSNYITAVLGQVDFMRQLSHSGRLDEAAITRGLDEIELAAQQGFRLTRKVLGFARSADSLMQAVELGPVVDDALRLGLRNDGEIRATSEVEEGLVVAGDRTELLQVLINLLLNARDALPDGGEVRVSALETRAEGEVAQRVGTEQHVLIEVKDTGIGMDEQTCARAFEPLFTTKPAEGGTGLGLSTVARIVENHHGVAQIESEPGKGTTVRIWLPSPHEDGKVGADTEEALDPPD